MKITTHKEFAHPCGARKLYDNNSNGITTVVESTVVGTGRDGQPVYAKRVTLYSVERHIFSERYIPAPCYYS